MKITNYEIIRGSKDGKIWTRLDLYFEAVDGDPYRVSHFLDSRTCRIIGLKDEECKQKNG